MSEDFGSSFYKYSYYSKQYISESIIIKINLSQAIESMIEMSSSILKRKV